MASNYLIYATLIIFIIVILIIIFLIKCFQALKSMDSSFAKLGYIAREDTKKYFDESYQKAIEIYQKSAAVNQNTIELSIEKVLSDSSQVIKESLSKAEKDALGIIMEANKDADLIRKQAKDEAAKYFDQLVDKSSQAIDWAFQQFLNEKMTITEHEDIIDRLIKIYAAEHKDN